MARLGPVERLNRQFADTYGSRAITTQQGRQAYDRDGLYTKTHLQTFLAAIQRGQNRWALDVQIPWRNKQQAYLMAEIYAVCSSLARGILELAGDAANDTMADTQPDSFIIRGESQTRARKIEDFLRAGFRKLKVGENGSQRQRIALKTGNCFGQKVYEFDGARWYMTKLLHMPSYQMVRNPEDDSYMQMSVGGMRGPTSTSEILAKWGPGYIANLAVEADHNTVYGVPLLEHVRVDYRLFIAACEDAAIAARTRAPQRFKWKYGSDKSFIAPTLESLEAWQDRQQIKPTTIATDIWLLNGLEEVEEIGGDAAGVMALVEMVESYMSSMKKACGFRRDEESLQGAGRESADSRYSSHINTLRIADWKYKKSVGDDLLLLEGITDVDWSTNIPPIGETQGNVTTRASVELSNCHTGLRQYCAERGIKDVNALKEDIRDWKEFCDEIGIPAWKGDKGDNETATDQTRTPRVDVPGSESPKKGADPQAGRSRREQQRRDGRKPTGA